MLWPAGFGALALALVTRRPPASLLETSVATLCTVVPGCLLFAPTILLAYHALTIMALPVFLGLAGHLVLLVYTTEQPLPARQPDSPRR